MKWALKIPAKIVLSRLPISYKAWKTIGIFRHGRMDISEYPLKIFNLHSKRAYPAGLPENAVILELGPGDSIASALVGSSFGAKKIYLVDVGSFAEKDVSFYQKIAAELSAKGLNVPDLSKASTFDDILKICNAEYLTNGLESLKAIPSGTVDFIWSHSVLEHVRKDSFVNVTAETKRILKPGAKASHNIDFQDHLEYSLNNLRFSEKVWESPLFANSGFYTNRIPAVKMHRMFRDAGYTINQEEFGQWPKLPIPKSKMHQEFQSYSDQDLNNRTSFVLLTA